ncbi:MAG TPA: phosphatidylserine decarboxylase, partial [Flavobacteriales bacterium]|nr:phosphatidylserine decarboxylase [Flavobacteriales bacterium]
MTLHREGTPTILITIAVVCSGLFTAWTWMPAWAAWTFTVLLLLILCIVLWFFRVPARRITEDENAVISPCDGKVVAIELVEETEYFKDQRRQVSIFMSPLN